MRNAKRLLLVPVVSLAFAAQASDDCLKGGEPVICSYEPNAFGFTKEGKRDRGFLDVKMSLAYRLFPEWIQDTWGGDTEAYLAASVRFGQYLKSDSAPVIGKRFNPKFVVRRLDGESRIDFAYGHESNGQSINTQAEFDSALSTPKSAEFARDQVSRGWDYLEIEWKKPLGEAGPVTLYGKFKYFLPNGLFQGRAEEYNAWEMDPEGKPRNQVNGVAAMLKYVRGDARRFREIKFFFEYETGYRHIFRYSTFRGEVAAKFMQLPINIWVQNGYGDSLALYYKRMSSYGIQVQVGAF
ncbi:MAG: hypothetical protein OEZ08_00945 [Betaproteobacteria bacterium]|nr:hypothetical protein [Betaproteobacteria bacterium]